VAAHAKQLAGPVPVSKDESALTARAPSPSCRLSGMEVDLALVCGPLRSHGRDARAAPLPARRRFPSLDAARGCPINSVPLPCLPAP
jgi:hypothetical protein